MFCAIVGLLASPLICASADFLPTARPAYEETFRMYGPDPDCYNRDSHISYLTELKRHPVQSGDDPVQYDRAIDQYVARLRYYCR